MSGADDGRGRRGSGSSRRRRSPLRLHRPWCARPASTRASCIDVGQLRRHLTVFLIAGIDCARIDDGEAVCETRESRKNQTDANEGKHGPGSSKRRAGLPTFGFGGLSWTFSVPKAHRRWGARSPRQHRLRLVRNRFAETIRRFLRPSFSTPPLARFGTVSSQISTAGQCCREQCKDRASHDRIATSLVKCPKSAQRSQQSPRR